MKIAATLLLFLVLCLPNAHSQEHTQLFLPEGAVARFGKGYVGDVQYSPDGSRLAVGTSMGVWLYDTTTYQEVALVTARTNWYTSVVFSPDRKTLAGQSEDYTVGL